MRRMPGWMPSLLRQINWGCTNSSIFNGNEDTDVNFRSGQRCCRQLFFFIRELPANIAAVRDTLPPHMEAARMLLTELADEERIYQNLFIKQCQLARLNPEELALETPSPSTQSLCDIMRTYCQSLDYREGILAIVTAELAATAFCRSAVPTWEKYFNDHSSSYKQGEVEEGLKWLHLHTQPHTKHALWMKRMLEDLDEKSVDQLPQPVVQVLDAVFDFLQCPQTGRPQNKKDLSLAQNK